MEKLANLTPACISVSVPHLIEMRLSEVWLLPEARLGKPPHEVDEFRLRKSGVSSEQTTRPRVSRPEDWDYKTELVEPVSSECLTDLTDLTMHIKNVEL